jgi:molybdopterin-guanine dinucleotide biosynthesis protein A
MRHQRQINGGQIEDGIILTNFKRVAMYIKDLVYNGPLDVCVKSLRSHDGHLVGAQGGDLPFLNGEELSVLVKKVTTNKKLCSKVGTLILF